MISYPVDYCNMPSLKKKPSATVLVKRKGTKVVQKLNPFEVRINKKKHDVLGQKSKSDKGLPGVARSKAVKKVWVCRLRQISTSLVYLMYPFSARRLC